jgi:hypothetical protein
MTRFTRARFVTALALCLGAAAVPAWSQERPAFAKKGVYVGATGVPDFTLDGVTFDGLSYYQKTDSEETLILPRLQPKSTVRAIVGFRSKRGSFEVSYEQTKHGGTFLDLPGEATFRSINFDERNFMLDGRRIQPYGLVGLSAPRLRVHDGSFLDPDVADGVFKGYGVNTETGATVFAHPRFGVSVGYRYRMMWFDSASGVSRITLRLRPRFKETAGGLAITGLFTF